MNKLFKRRKTYLDDGIRLIFWVRFSAFLVDYIILSLIYRGFLLLVKPLISLSFLNTLISFPLVLIYVLTAALFESSRIQATPAKYFFRLKVFKTDGSKVNFPISLLRNILKIVSSISLIGAWLINLTKRRQALHDLIVGSIVKKI